MRLLLLLLLSMAMAVRPILLRGCADMSCPATLNVANYLLFDHLDMSEINFRST